jgi:hypothetical protein
MRAGSNYDDQALAAKRNSADATGQSCTGIFLDSASSLSHLSFYCGDCRCSSVGLSDTMFTFSFVVLGARGQVLRLRVSIRVFNSM